MHPRGHLGLVSRLRVELKALSDPSRERMVPESSGRLPLRNARERNTWVWMQHEASCRREASYIHPIRVATSPVQRNPPIPHLYPCLCFTISETLAACWPKWCQAIVAGASNFHVRRHSTNGDFHRVSSNETCFRMSSKRSSILAQIAHHEPDKVDMAEEWGISRLSHAVPSPKAKTTRRRSVRHRAQRRRVPGPAGGGGGGGNQSVGKAGSGGPPLLSAPGTSASFLSAEETIRDSISGNLGGIDDVMHLQIR